MSEYSARSFRWVPSLICSMLLLACGGSGGGDYQSVASQQPAPAAVSGRAVKGVLSAAVVKAFPVSNGQVSPTALTQTKTDASGYYQLSLPPGYGGQVVIQVTAGADSADPTLMTCDVLAGCGHFESYPSRGPANQDLKSPWGEINYGDLFALNAQDNFELLSISETLKPGTTIVSNVTALSHLTAKYLMQSSVSAEALLQARNQMADLFGLPADFDALTPVDVSSPSEVAHADTGQLQASFLSASIMASGMDAGTGQMPGIQLTQHLTTLSAHYVSLGGQLIARDSNAARSVPTLQELNSTASDMMQQLAVDNGNVPSAVNRFAALNTRVAMLADGAVTQASAGNLVPTDTAEQFFTAQIWPLLNQDCTNCHNAGGLAGGSALVFDAVLGSSHNFNIIQNYILASNIKHNQSGATLIVAKPVGDYAHVGGQVYPAGGPQANLLASLVSRVTTGSSAGPVQTPVPPGTGGNGGSGAPGGSGGGAATPTGNALLDEFVTYIVPTLDANACQACHRTGGSGSGFTPGWHDFRCAAGEFHCYSNLFAEQCVTHDFP